MNSINSSFYNYSNSTCLDYLSKCEKTRSYSTKNFRERIKSIFIIGLAAFIELKRAK